MTFLKAAQLVSSTQIPISTHCLSTRRPHRCGLPSPKATGRRQSRRQGPRTAPSGELSPAQAAFVGNPGSALRGSPFILEKTSLFCSEGSHFQQFHALFACPALGLLREAGPSRQSST